MSFSHASVGGNIWSGLEALASDSAYAFPNWKDNARGNPGWEAKIADFEGWVAAHANEYDVFQNKFCYIDQEADFATYRDSMNRLASTYPQKSIVWWTMPIMTNDSDNAKRQAFNSQVRAYCNANDRPIFDIADIESHKNDGSAVANSGVEAMDPDQSSDGGHLSELGASRTAQAQWVLMAKLAGWKSTSTGGAGNLAPSGSSDDSGCSIARSSASSGFVGLLVSLAIAGLTRRRSRSFSRPARSYRAKDPRKNN
jgi:hypothetical protein